MDPATLTAELLLQNYARRKLSPTEALQAVTDRIARLNPDINAFVLLDPAAQDAATASTARWQAGRPLGLLDGVPVTVKDLVDVAGHPTRRGSKTTSPQPVAADAPLVLGLKAEGAVIVGKTTTTEFGWKSPGDCPQTGITRNPWNPRHTTGGSSAGAGAAAAAGFAPLHVGTDAGGSIRIPAAWCGVVGFKPTYGRVPQWPAGAFATVSCAGPLARSVRDAALMFSAMARFDARDPFCLPDDRRDWRDETRSGVAGLRVALVRAPGFAAPAGSEEWRAVEDAARLLADAGAIVEPADPALPDTRAIFSRVWSVALSRLVGGIAEAQRPLLDPGLRQVAGAVTAMTAAEYLDAEAMRIAAAHAMGQFHRDYDLLLCPVVPHAAPLVDEPVVDPLEALWQHWAPWTFAFNLTRQPAISVPVGRDADGLPRAVQIAAACYRDDVVLRAAQVVEAGFASAAALPPG